jgi:maleylacetoacetate isomerase
MRLYSYFRSSAAWRVRIALALKGLEPEFAYVHLLRAGGEQKSADYARTNPMRLVPALETDDDGVVTQSLAICEYLEERYPEPPLLPADVGDRAYVRAIAAAIACDIHPLNNLRVLQRLTGEMGISADGRTDWYRHWIAEGFAGLETLISASGRSGLFCFGDAPTLAEVFLVPQMANARRFDCDLGPFPTLVAIDARAAALTAFTSSAPEAQADRE